MRKETKEVMNQTDVLEMRNGNISRLKENQKKLGTIDSLCLERSELSSLTQCLGHEN